MESYSRPIGQGISSQQIQHAPFQQSLLQDPFRPPAGNLGHIIDLENDGGQPIHHNNRIFYPGDRNAARHLRNVVQEHSQENIPWEPYRSHADSVASILGRHIGSLACCGSITSGLGATGGALGGIHQSQMILRNALLGVGTGLALTAGTAVLTVWGETVRQNEEIERNRQNIHALRFSKLAIAGKGILNAPALAVPFQPRYQYIANQVPNHATLAQVLAPVLDEIPRTDNANRVTRQNDKRVADLIHILHEDPESAATNSLVEALHTLANDALIENSRLPHDMLTRIDRIIADWKKQKTNDFTSMVLHKSMIDARVPRDSWQYKHAYWAIGKGDVSTYLRLKNADLSCPVVKENHLQNVLKRLGTSQTWKAHLERHAPHYLDQLAEIRSFISAIMGYLDAQDETMKDEWYRQGADYLGEVHNGNLLAQWYAEESLKNPDFFITVDAGWLRRKLVAEFRCIGVPESCMPELIEKYFDKKNAIQHALENIPSSPHAVNQHQSMNWRVKGAPLMAESFDLEAQKEVQADPMDTQGQNEILTEQSVLSVNEFIKGQAFPSARRDRDV